jgi:photosynthetic reaction center cytochrome c subunit
MKQNIKIALVIAFLCGSAFVFTRSGNMQTGPAPKTDGVKTAGEAFKNIQVLKDMPADQLDHVMGIFTGALGVKCNFCHVPNQWEKDDKEEKRTAREMIKMVLALNKNYFDNHLEVSCATCHGGRAHPLSIPPIGQTLADNPHGPTANASKDPLPTIDQVLDKYVQSVGGQAAIDKVKTRVIKASRVGADGRAVTEDIYQKGNDHILVVTSFPQGSMTNGYSGTGVWVTNGRGETHALEGDEAEQFKREAQLFDPAKLKSVYKDMSVSGIDKINDKEVFVVRAVTPQGGRERLYFDKQTGLLVRRTASSMTVIGIFPFQVDYSDYKVIDGVQIPMTVTSSTPGRAWTRKITDVKLNAAIDDAKFNQPAK